jgi:hypothetical protein
MENNIKKVEDEIRQYKLYKIQTTESKIREYEDIYSLIKENIIVKFTKNSFSNIFRLLLTIISIGLILLSFTLIFPEIAISLIGKTGEIMTQSDRNDMVETFPYYGYFILGLGFLFGIISVLLKKNNRKRTVIYELSKLTDEVIYYMNENVKEEKKKYEYFVDSIAEIETKNKENTTQQKI